MTAVAGLIVFIMAKLCNCDTACLTAFSITGTACLNALSITGTACLNAFSITGTACLNAGHDGFSFSLGAKSKFRKQHFIFDCCILYVTIYFSQYNLFFNLFLSLQFLCVWPYTLQTSV